MIAETTAIVLSILLALGVDEWREVQRERSLEHEYLQRLLDDTAANTGVLDVQRTSEVSQIANARLVYPLVSHGEWPNADTATVVLSSYNATPSPTPTWVDDTFDELKSTGRVGLLRSAELRGELLAYYRFLDAQDYTYQLMSTEYRDAVRARLDPDLQLRIRESCTGGEREVGCPVDIADFPLRLYLNWFTANEDPASGLRKVILQWTRRETEYLPRVEQRTERLRALLNAELAR